MKRLLRLIKYYHPKRISSLYRRINQIEKKMTFLVENPDALWLENNKVERMDALVDNDSYMHKTRREFHLDRYIFASNFVEDKVVADIACGTGYGTRFLIEKGKAFKCIGVDIDKKAILYSQKNHAVEGSEYICAPAENIPLKDESLDVIVSFETLEHVSDENIFVNEFFRLLKRNGMLIISTPNSWPLSIAPYHTKEYDLIEFKRILSTKFKIKEIYNQNSGSPWVYNHDQEKGIIKTSESNKDLAECYIAVCVKNDPEILK